MIKTILTNLPLIGFFYWIRKRNAVLKNPTHSSVELAQTQLDRQYLITAGFLILLIILAPIIGGIIGKILGG